MAVILEKDLKRGSDALAQWRAAAREMVGISVAEVGDTGTVSTDNSYAGAGRATGNNADGRAGKTPMANGVAQSPNTDGMGHVAPQTRLAVSPTLPRPVWAMAVRYSLFLLERRAPGPGVEVRVAPWGAVKILDGPESDPHNLTPPDVIELDPEVWLRLACGITTWAEEKDAGHISAVGERDDLSDLLPL